MTRRGADRTVPTCLAKKSVAALQELIDAAIQFIKEMKQAEADLMQSMPRL
ncbi:MAG: hypothetical protein ACE368_16315 [Paracoccaceae bacterium]